MKEKSNANKLARLYESYSGEKERGLTMNPETSYVKFFVETSMLSYYRKLFHEEKCSLLSRIKDLEAEEFVRKNQYDQVRGELNERRKQLEELA